jgi:hypothetical protein
MRSYTLIYARAIRDLLIGPTPEHTCVISAMDFKRQTSKRQTAVDYDKSIIEDLVDAYGKRLTLHKMSGMSTLWLNNRLEVLDFTHRFLHKEQLMADWKRKRDTMQEMKDQSQSKMKTRRSDLQANNDVADRDMPMRAMSQGFGKEAAVHWHHCS